MGSGASALITQTRYLDLRLDVDLEVAWIKPLDFETDEEMSAPDPSELPYFALRDYDQACMYIYMIHMYVYILCLLSSIVCFDNANGIQVVHLEESFRLR